jgi:hypothetical protein
MISGESTAAVTPVNAEGSFEGRWDAWRARGVAHDRVVSRRLKELIPALVLVAVVVYLFILMW